ncbi:MAG: phosphonoacetaldehyde hydrolase [Mariniblastus sp.]|nr:phosphonoacetaldehyde hydrolase [Mariniblastus sp.]
MEMSQKPNPNTVAAIIFDWAGTMVDYGSRAPATVFQRVFEQEGVPITAGQAREPMGMAKREHIATITQMPEVADRWIEKFGSPASDEDVDRMYHDFLPLQKSVLSDHSDMIPGAVETFRWCLENGIKVGSSTGYTHELMEVVSPLAAAAGYQPEVILCAEDAPQGRPAPWLIFECAKRLGVYPARRIVKVDDTIVGIEAGCNAGTWTVGVTRSGNLVGLSEAEFDALPESDQQQRLADASGAMFDAGADFVIESVKEIPELVDKINAQMATGALPDDTRFGVNVDDA